MSQIGPYVMQKGKLSRQSLIGECIIEKFKEVNRGDSTKKLKGTDGYSHMSTIQV